MDRILGLSTASEGGVVEQAFVNMASCSWINIFTGSGRCDLSAHRFETKSFGGWWAKIHSEWITSGATLTTIVISALYTLGTICPFILGR